MLKVEEQQPVAFSLSLIEKLNEIVGRYPEGKQKSAMLPILHEVQAEQWIKLLLF
jgi:NADH-quinone oxidoreductase subunit E